MFGLSALLLFVVFGFLGFIIVPFVYFVTKNAVHRCSRCLSKMGEKRCFGLPDDWHSPVSLVDKSNFLVRSGTSEWENAPSSSPECTPC